MKDSLGCRVKFAHKISPSLPVYIVLVTADNDRKGEK